MVSGSDLKGKGHGKGPRVTCYLEYPFGCAFLTEEVFERTRQHYAALNSGVRIPNMVGDGKAREHEDEIAV